MLKLGNGILKPRGALGHERFELRGAVGQLCLRPRQQLLRLFALSDVVKAIDSSGNFSLFVLQRTDIHDHDHTRTVRPFNEHFRVVRRRNFASDHLGHRTLFVGHKTAVRPEQFV